MIVTADEVNRSFKGTLDLLNSRAEGLKSFNMSERGFWRSWWAVLFCLPPTLLSWASFRLYFLTQAPQGTTTGPIFFLKLAVVEAANWLIPLLIVLVLARIAGFNRAALPLVVVLNLLSVPLQWAYVPVSLIQIWAPADTSAALLYLLTLGSYVFITYRIAVSILGGQKFPAFVLVMVVFSVPLMVQSQLLTMLGLVEL